MIFILISGQKGSPAPDINFEPIRGDRGEGGPPGLRGMDGLPGLIGKNKYLSLPHKINELAVCLTLENTLVLLEKKIQIKFE